MTSSAAERWAAALARWRIPDEVATVPAAIGFPVQRFADIADLSVTLDSPSRRIATAALPIGGSVLDVGCGAGAGSLPLAPPAARLIGVDIQASMLEAFRERALARGATATGVLGPWQEVLDDLAGADVVVSHHTAYGTPELGDLGHALAAKARRRVVLELSAEHPTAWTHPYWQAIHGIEAPSGPTSDDAADVLREAGIDVEVEHWEAAAPLPPESEEDQLRFLRARLRVGEERDEELLDLLRDHPRPAWRHVTTLWWSVT
jgi:SAM-dependent methyltransferase